MALKILKPWLQADRTNDERLEDFFARDESLVEWKLMAAWDDVLDDVSWYQGQVDAQLKEHAATQTDALTAGWIKDIAARIGALQTKLPNTQGELSREELLSAAADRLSSSTNIKQNLVAECTALRQECQFRPAMLPLGRFR